jgi:hypothetical protein
MKGRLSQLTTVFVNTFRTDPESRWFQVVSGRRNGIGQIGFLTLTRKKFHIATG